MADDLRRHVDLVFSNVEDSQNVRELKEELIANLTEKHCDLLSCGLSEKEAYRRAQGHP